MFEPSKEKYEKYAAVLNFYFSQKLRMISEIFSHNGFTESFNEN